MPPLNSPVERPVVCLRQSRTSTTGFALLEQHINHSKTGRRGMDSWKILVMGSVRLSGNIDYDELHDLANNHWQIREILGMRGITAWNKKPYFPMQTVKDNASLLTPELLNKINTLVVPADISSLKKDQDLIKSRKVSEAQLGHH